MIYIPKPGSMQEVWKNYCSTRLQDPGTLKTRIRKSDVQEIRSKALRQAMLVTGGVVLVVLAVRGVISFLSRLVG